MKTPCTILATALAAVLRAAVPVAWTNSPGMPPYPIKPVPHGVPVDFRVTLKGYTEPLIAPGADLHLWYQTNGMGAAWWSAPATLDGDVITATFGPAQDTGADRVSLFFGAPSNVFAAAVLRLTHSPGFAPASLPLPVPVLDFSAVEVRGLAALTNGWTFGDAGGPYLSATGGTIIAQLATPDAGLEVRMPGIPMLGSPPRATRMRADGFGVSNLAGDWLWLDSLGFRFVRGGDDVRFNLPLGTTGGTLARLEDVDLAAATNYTDAVATEFESGERVVSRALNAEWSADAGYATMADMAALLEYGADGMSANDLIRESANAAEAVTERSTNALKQDIADLRTESQLVYRLYQGSNVVAEVTNYNSSVHAPELRIMQLNESNEYYTVWAETNGLARTLRDATNYAASAIAEHAAPRAWSKVTAGMGVEAPSNTTWLSTARTVIAGGLEYEKHVTSGGSIWLLEANGMTADFHAQTNNTAFLDLANADGTPIFRVEKTDSFLVGVHIDAVTVDGNALVCSVGVVAAEHPLVRVRASLSSGEWIREEDGIPASLATVTWSGSTGNWTCRIANNTGGGQLFAQMEYLQEGGTKIVNSAPMSVSQGILCTDGIHKCRPVYSNGSITWEVVP